MSDPGKVALPTSTVTVRCALVHDPG